MVWYCLENKKFVFGKPNKENKAQGRVFSMTHRDT